MEHDWIYRRNSAKPICSSCCKGLISGAIAVNVFGINPSFNSADTPVDIWSQSGIWVPPTSACLHNVKSSSTSDTLGSTGAITVLVKGLNATYDIVSETITLNGTNNVSTVNQYIFISHMAVLTAGSGGTNAGTITATATSGGTVSNAISIGNGNDSLGAYQIPRGYTGYLLDWQAGMKNNTASSSADVKLFVKTFGSIYALQGFHSLSNSGSSVEGDTFIIPDPFTEKSIIKIQCSSASNNSNLVQARMQIVLFANNT